MRTRTLLFICQFGLCTSVAANLNSLKVESALSEVMTIEPSSSTGINMIFVVNNPNDITLTYTSSTGGKTTWQKFYDQGLSYSQPLNVIYDHKISYLSNAETNVGYMISDGESEVFFWIIDYSKYTFSCESLLPSSQCDCYATVLDFLGDAKPIIFYGPTGRKNIIGRGIELAYTTVVWDEDLNVFTEQNEVKILDSIDKEIVIIPPVYSETSYTITGDIFSDFFDQKTELSSSIFFPCAVDAKTTVPQDGSGNSSNTISPGTVDLGGNAPCQILFSAETTPAVIHSEWQIAFDPDFNDIIYRFNDKEIEHTFSETGTYYSRFIGSNQDGSCESIGDVYTIEIGESQLLVPNFFSPNNDNINDEWKVSHQSLTQFECWIFDKAGKQVFHFNDPSEGWDGKINGRSVKSGVFYYVIKAVGADKKIYDLSGDINIISSTQKSQTY